MVIQFGAGGGYFCIIHLLIFFYNQKDSTMEVKLKVGDIFVIQGTEVKMKVTSDDGQRFYGHYVDQKGSNTGNAILEKNLLKNRWFVGKIQILN
jgi:hypothetical protein